MENAWNLSWTEMSIRSQIWVNTEKRITRIQIAKMKLF